MLTVIWSMLRVLLNNHSLTPRARNGGVHDQSPKAARMDSHNYSEKENAPNVMRPNGRNIPTASDPGGSWSARFEVRRTTLISRRTKTSDVHTTHISPLSHRLATTKAAFPPPKTPQSNLVSPPNTIMSLEERKQHEQARCPPEKELTNKPP